VLAEEVLAVDEIDESVSEFKLFLTVMNTIFQVKKIKKGKK